MSPDQIDLAARKYGIPLTRAVRDSESYRNWARLVEQVEINLIYSDADHAAEASRLIAEAVVACI